MMSMVCDGRSKSGATHEGSEPARARGKLLQVCLWQEKHQIICFEVDGEIKIFGCSI